MPKSKRDKKISLTNTAKKGLKFKQQLVEDVRKCVDNYERIFVFSVQNMRNGQLKELRDELKSDSRFFFGKNKVMQLGLGKDKQDEYQTKLHQVSKHLIGQRGLLFTNRSKSDVINFFNTYSKADFARSGFVATEDVVLPEGPLPDFPHSLEPQLRQLGMPTSLQRGIITLLQDYPVCKKGKTLTPEQARILKLIGKTMAEFSVALICMWDKETGKFKKLKSEKSGKENTVQAEDDFELRMDEDNAAGSGDEGIEDDGGDDDDAEEDDAEGDEEIEEDE